LQAEFTALKDFLEAKGIELSDGNPKSWVADCISPSCGKEKHMYIRRRSGAAICFRCGTKWGWKQLVAELEDCLVEESWSIVFGRGAEGKVDEWSEEIEFGDTWEDEDEAPEKPFTFGIGFQPLEASERGLAYMASRGCLDPNLIVQFDMKWSRTLDSVVFPVKRNGVTYGWQARKVELKDGDLKPGDLRLLSMTGMNKSKHLLNYDYARTTIAVAEGPFDAFKLCMGGLGGVCSFGKQVSRAQVKLILDSPATSVYVAIDPDAVEAATRLIDLLGNSKKVLRIFPPEGRKDFGACTVEEVRQAVADAQEISSPSDRLEAFFDTDKN
jgi:hypothetical protein